MRRETSPFKKGKILPNKLILQLASLVMITIAGPLIVVLLFLRQGNL